MGERRFRRYSRAFSVAITSRFEISHASPLAETLSIMDVGKVEKIIPYSPFPLVCCAMRLYIYAWGSHVFPQRQGVPLYDDDQHVKLQAATGPW